VRVVGAPDETLVLDRDALADDLRSRVFPAGVVSPTTPRIGAEVELIPVDRATGRPLPLDGADRSTLEILRRAGARLGWRERSSAKATVPEIEMPDGGLITFEPGGQIEISAAPNASLSALVAGLRSTVASITDAAPPDVGLLSVGIDPETPVEAVPPQLHAERYRRMLAHFDTIGPSGARMMRQTASFQVCVDATESPTRTWRMLNALAPFLVAMFANSPRYAGRDSGHKSFRREIWASLDPRRTGVLGIDEDPIAEYLDFALDAPAFLLGDARQNAMPFGCWLDRGPVSVADWCAHLTTLFPEVRPRGYFEVRSPDAVPPAWYPVPLVLVAGLAYHPPSLDAAADLLGTPSRELLACAGREGLANPTLARVAPLLCNLALDGCAALGDRFASPSDLATAAEYFDRYTNRGRSLADDS
jgi:glutamate--cysteine ligase